MIAQIWPFFKIEDKVRLTKTETLVESSIPLLNIEQIDDGSVWCCCFTWRWFCKPHKTAVNLFRCSTSSLVLAI